MKLLLLICIAAVVFVIASCTGATTATSRAVGIYNTDKTAGFYRNRPGWPDCH